MKKPIIIDCQYIQPQFAAAYLIIEKERALFVENNTFHSVPILLSELRKNNLSPEQVEYLIITHVHLDHAGGTSALMKACPNAILLAHPRAAPHIIDPKKLIKSARQVYGDVVFEKLYGEINPVEPKRVRTVQDGEKIQFGSSRTLEFIYTRGHANHHFCIIDNESEGIFTGDSFGIAYPSLQKEGLFIFPSTSPTDFDPAEARNSIRKILGSGAKSAYLTHFGQISNLEFAAEQLLEHIDKSEKILDQASQGLESYDRLVDFCKIELRSYFKKILEKRKMASKKEIWETLKLDIDLNAAGIAFSAQKRKSIPHGVL